MTISLADCLYKMKTDACFASKLSSLTSSSQPLKSIKLTAVRDWPSYLPPSFKAYLLGHQNEEVFQLQTSSMLLGLNVLQSS